MDSADKAQHGARGQGLGGTDRPPDEEPGIDGVSLADLEPLTTVLVRTANTRYRIIVLRGATVLVKGGRSFPEITRGDLFSFGVNVVRVGWIGLGLRMEIHSGNRSIVTTPVREFTIEPSATAAPAA